MAAAGLSRVRARREFTRILEGRLRAPGGGRRGGDARRTANLKSYVLDSTGRLRRRAKTDLASWRMYDTEIPGLSILNVSLGGGAPVRFFTDIGDGRLVTLHTNDRARDAQRAVAALVDGSRGMLDNVWLHRGMLEHVAERAGRTRPELPDRAADGPAAKSEGSKGAPARKDMRAGSDRPGRHAKGGRGLGSGRASGSVRILRGQHGRESGYAHVDVTGAGCFAARRGGSVRDHLEIVEEFKEAYTRAVSRVDDCRLGAEDIGGGAAILRGQALNFSLPGQIADVEGFIDRVFAPAKPFQLLGIKSAIGPGYYRVLAVDLRIGDPMTCEVAGGMMRVYLPQRSRGGTVMRLLANLQASYGTGVRCMEVDQAVGQHAGAVRPPPAP